MGDVAGVVTSEERELLVYVRAAVLYPPPDREVIHHSWGWFRAVGTLGVLSGLLGGASLGFREIVFDGYKMISSSRRSGQSMIERSSLSAFTVARNITWAEVRRVHFDKEFLVAVVWYRVTVPIMLEDWSTRRIACRSSAGRSCRAASLAHHRSTRTVRVSSDALEITPATRSRSMRRYVSQHLGTWQGLYSVLGVTTVVVERSMQRVTLLVSSSDKASRCKKLFQRLFRGGGAREDPDRARRPSNRLLVRGFRGLLPGSGESKGCLAGWRWMEWRIPEGRGRDPRLTARAVGLGIAMVMLKAELEVEPSTLCRRLGEGYECGEVQGEDFPVFPRERLKCISRDRGVLCVREGGDRGSVGMFLTKVDVYRDTTVRAGAVGAGPGGSSFTVHLSHQCSIEWRVEEAKLMMSGSSGSARVSGGLPIPLGTAVDICGDCGREILCCQVHSAVGAGGGGQCSWSNCVDNPAFLGNRSCRAFPSSQQCATLKVIELILEQVLALVQDIHQVRSGVEAGEVVCEEDCTSGSDIPGGDSQPRLVDVSSSGSVGSAKTPRELTYALVD
eukprot:g45877.t1